MDPEYPDDFKYKILEIIDKEDFNYTKECKYWIKN